jgi:hypothetical protein
MGYQPSTWGTVAQWAGAVGTISAVLVALFKDEILRNRRRPKLNVSITLGPPDSVKTIWNYQILAPNLQTYIAKQADCYFMRLWIENQGKTRAEKVQVFASKLLKEAEAGTFHPVKNFLPMNLQWANSHELFAEAISPYMGKHCDLGHIMTPSALVALQEDLPAVPSEHTVLALDLEVKPSTKNHLISPGRYLLELKIAGANVLPVVTTLDITLTGKWYDDAEKMFGDAIKLTITNRY